MDPRRPLQVLPLAYFLPAENAQDPRASPYRSAIKRSRSPSALLSPAKRRILHQEGYLLSSSEPAKPTDRGRAIIKDARTRSQLQAALIALSGKQSNRDADDSPSIHALAHNGRPVASSSRNAHALRPRLTSSRQSSGSSSAEIRSLNVSERIVAPLLVPRELPPRPDPQSCHYPGFDIYYDTHLELPSTSSRYLLESELDLDRDSTKENLPPRKRTRKAGSVPVDVGSTDIFGEVAIEERNAASWPVTPYHNSPLPTPSSSKIHRTPFSNKRIGHEFTPGRSSGTAADMLAGKLALEEEVDDVYSDEEEF